MMNETSKEIGRPHGTARYGREAHSQGRYVQLPLPRRTRATTRRKQRGKTKSARNNCFRCHSDLLCANKKKKKKKKNPSAGYYNFGG
jgi:hypothetical protein